MIDHRHHAHGVMESDGAVFAVNSAIHSYLIVAYAEADGVSLDVGFYYMSNAAGRLLGTVASGLIYQLYGFELCLLVSSAFVALATVISWGLPSGKAAGSIDSSGARR